MLKDVLELTPDPEGVEMFLFLANRVITLFPEEDRIICKIETDDKSAGKINLRVMSYSPSEKAAVMARERPEQACA